MKKNRLRVDDKCDTVLGAFITKRVSFWLRYCIINENKKFGKRDDREFRNQWI